jgi:hypothetical protein
MRNAEVGFEFEEGGDTIRDEVSMKIAIKCKQSERARDRVLEVKWK